MSLSSNPLYSVRSFSPLPSTIWRFMPSAIHSQSMASRLWSLCCSCCSCILRNKILSVSLISSRQGIPASFRYQCFKSFILYFFPCKHLPFVPFLCVGHFILLSQNSLLKAQIACERLCFCESGRGCSLGKPIYSCYHFIVLS